MPGNRQVGLTLERISDADRREATIVAVENPRDEDRLFGLQFSFGLQQADMGPIYRFLDADEATMPLLWRAGPMTGLIIQPNVGAMSDRTNSRYGRRTPYFLVGAIISRSVCS